MREGKLRMCDGVGGRLGAIRWALASHVYGFLNCLRCLFPER